MFVRRRYTREVRKRDRERKRDSLRRPLLLILLIAIAFAGSVGLIVFLSMFNQNQGYYPPGTIICRDQPITPEELRPHLGGVFKGKEQVFYDAAVNNGIDVVLLAAIAIHETGNGTSKAVREKNNPGGIMGSGGLRTFATLDEGIHAMAKLLYDGYISQGLTTIAQIGRKYAPVGANNDPNNLNAHWVPNVTKIANELGGISGNCSETGGIIPLDPSELGFQFPQERIVLTSDFGPRSCQGCSSYHKGIDMDLGDNTPILASQSGTVEFASFGTSGSGFYGYGNCVVINHHNGFWTLYGHLSRIHVRVGDQVQRGQVIGIIGNTGKSTRTHLHFEIKTSFMGGQVNPRRYLPPF